jgi:hypothetical protein
LISALVTKRGENLCVPCNTATLLKEISEAMGLDIPPFNLGKYIFQHPEESDTIDKILLTYLPETSRKSQTTAHIRKSSLPPLDLFMLKSNILKDMLESEIVLAYKNPESNTKDEWDLVKELRTKILSRIQVIENGETKT